MNRGTVPSDRVRTCAAYVFLVGVSAALAGSRTLAPAAGSVELDPANGAIVRAAPTGAPDSIWRSGEDGLWRLSIAGGSGCSASAFDADGPTNRCEFLSSPTAAVQRIRYAGAAATVEVTAAASAAGVDLSAVVTPVSGTVTELTLPGRLRFEPGRVRQFVTPLNPHEGVGAALNRAFFLPQPPDRPSGWEPATTGSKAAVHLFGAGFDMRDLAAPPVALQPTPEGVRRLGTNLASRIAAARAKVNRAYRAPQADVSLIGSSQGPFLAGARLGGTGALWRFGGELDESSAGLAVDAAGALIRFQAAADPGRTVVALVSLLNGPPQGAFANGSVARWRERLERIAGERRLQFVQLRTADEMLAAARRTDVLAIVNPYGEWLPVPAGREIVDAVDVIAAFVRAGGHWFETGGYSFHAALRPSLHLRIETPYPPAFSDFLHLDSESGAASLYGVQPRTWEPWAGARDRRAILVPGRIGVGADDRGGWCEHAFATWVPPGVVWTSPVVRMATGRDALQGLRDYAAANRIDRPLSAKLPPERLAFFRRALLLKLDGTAAEKTAALDRLPAGTLIHFSDYLKGGFDKEYPDHLPPHPRFGTPQEFAAFLRLARGKGHWTMPYSNPTWWCDHPRGPSFERAGEAALLRTPEGATSHESYGPNDGWATCLWHPAVRAANRETLRQFTERYPVDILFQDQCGARGWRYDMNPASPAPWAYAEGMLSMVDEDRRSILLSTEDGHDRVLDAEIQMCGFTFALGPGRPRPVWVREFKTTLHPTTWRIFPVAQAVAHDKAAFAHHDLGKFVKDPVTLAWTLGLGFVMSDHLSARALDEPGPREWLFWLDRIQKSVCARYVGEPLVSFEHRQGGIEEGDDGAIEAVYGPVRVAANLGPTPWTADGRDLAPHGFRASAPGMAAGNLCRLAGWEPPGGSLMYVAEGDARRADVWFLGAPGAEAAAELPGGMNGAVSVVFDDAAPCPGEAVGGALRVRLPAHHPRPAPPSAGSVPRLWHAVVTRP